MPKVTQRLSRSYLYVPGDRPKMLAKAPARGADAIIVDLEDGVSPTVRIDAFEATVYLLSRTRATHVQWWARPAASLRDRVGELVGECLTGLVLPKVESADEVEVLDGVLATAEASVGMAIGATRIIPLIESARGLQQLDEIATAPRVLRLGTGEADLSADLGLMPGDAELELLSVRTSIVVASSAAGLDPPVASTSTDYRDLDRLATTTRRLARLGFRARTTIHPAQVQVVNVTFTPTADEVAAATEIVSDFQRLQSDGAWAGVATDGTMLDEAVVRSAQAVLARAGWAEPG